MGRPSYCKQGDKQRCLQAEKSNYGGFQPSPRGGDLRSCGVRLFRRIQFNLFSATPARSLLCRRQRPDGFQRAIELVAGITQDPPAAAGEAARFHEQAEILQAI